MSNSLLRTAARSHAARLELFRNSTALTRPESVTPAKIIPFKAPQKSEHDQLVAAARSICLAAQTDRLATFIGEARRLAALVYDGYLDKQLVVDRLLQAADAYGLVEEYGLDLIEGKISEALDQSALIAEDDKAVGELDAEAAQFQGQRLSVKCAADVKPEPISWLWPDRIAFGKLTLIAGDPGIGKSQITASIAAVVSNGGDWPNREGKAQVGRVLMFSAEDDDADTIRPRLDAAGADVRQVYFADGVRGSGGSGVAGFDLTRHVELLERQIERHNINVVILDPLNAFLGNTRSHEASQVRAALLPLTEMAARRGIAIIAIMHLTKAITGGAAMYRIVGSGAFSAVARSIFAVARDPDSIRVLFVPAKSNLGRGGIPGLAYRIEEKMTGSGIRAPAVVWEAVEITTTAEELFADVAPYTGGRGALVEAQEFLKEVLQEGPVDSKTIGRRAKEAGISESTLKRARLSLGLKSRKTGFGPDGKWGLAFADP
jgi:putative DNA primase/helicase